MARPIAASAAATVRTNKVNTCPTKSSIKLENATRFIFTAMSKISMAIKIIIMFFLLTNIPKIPIINKKEERNK
jgi:hypothetical protein